MRGSLQFLNIKSVDVIMLNQKQSSIGVFVKRYSENMQQVYRRTYIPMCDFNKAALIKVASQLY